MTGLTPEHLKRMRIEPTLRSCEDIIEGAVFAYAEAGGALRTIRDKKLFREEGHKTFEAYCRERWNWSRSYAHRTIEAGEVHDAIYDRGELLPMGNKVDPPRNERAARELVPLRDKPKVLTEVWIEVVEKHGPDATARQVKRVVAEVVEPAQKPVIEHKPKSLADAAASLRRMVSTGYGLDLIREALEQLERESNV